MLPKLSPLITLEKLKRWEACYWHPHRLPLEELLAIRCEKELLPATPLQIARCKWLPHVDRLWVLLRPSIIPKDDLCLFAEDDENKRRWLKEAATVNQQLARCRGVYGRVSARICRAYAAASRVPSSSSQARNAYASARAIEQAFLDEAIEILERIEEGELEQCPPKPQ